MLKNKHQDRQTNYKIRIFTLRTVSNGLLKQVSVGLKLKIIRVPCSKNNLQSGTMSPIEIWNQLFTDEILTETRKLANQE